MAIRGLKNTQGKGTTKEVYHYPTSKNALIIFTRNPVLGKCKTRLAATIGDQAALDIYKFLLQHTVKITTPLQVDKFVFYSEKVTENDIWDTTIFKKKQQEGSDLGMRMQHAFTDVFKMGYERAIIMGSDMYHIATSDLENAFTALKNNDYVMGPAEDGGYYLLGMKTINKTLFTNKDWGTDTVLRATKENLIDEKVKFLEVKNDIDVYEDIKNIPVFKKFLTTL